LIPADLLQKHSGVKETFIILLRMCQNAMFPVILVVREDGKMMPNEVGLSDDLISKGFNRYLSVLSGLVSCQRSSRTGKEPIRNMVKIYTCILAVLLLVFSFC
jgi:hypothetical protein